ncbi:hypothetical protein SAMN06296020_11139 [Anoxynatronum buryatiense]|uniref:Uncharacterized protein n=2 Tax=Anoxynatronum buryatiense TaxID=489973 RepID=A0AA45WXN7_9CLOT|nr:hypothetical protein SAMN06296020_11139 [Anoxynatronum buryatiense]
MAMAGFWVILNLLFLVLLILGISKIVKSRISKKISIWVMAIYFILLFFSPLMATMMQGADKINEPVRVPDSYFMSVVENADTMTLEDLVEDEHFVLLDVREIPVALNDFSKDRPLKIASRHRDHDQFDHMYRYQLMVEVTDEVENVEISQFVQRTYTDQVEISQELVPWSWTMTEGRLKPEIHQTEIVRHRLSPNPLLFHFQEKHNIIKNGSISQEMDFHFMIPEFRIIQWVRVPEDLHFLVQGVGPH